jgi:hypothetical protein
MDHITHGPYHSNKGLFKSSSSFDVGLRANTEVYLDVLKKVVKPWMAQQD